MLSGPFRFKYWVVRDQKGALRVVRNRLAYFARGMGDLVDGPFDSTADAAQSLSYWKAVDAGNAVPTPVPTPVPNPNTK